MTRVGMSAREAELKFYRECEGNWWGSDSSGQGWWVDGDGIIFSGSLLRYHDLPQIHPPFIIPACWRVSEGL